MENKARSLKPLQGPSQPADRTDLYNLPTFRLLWAVGDYI